VLGEVVGRLLHPQRAVGMSEFLARPTEALAAPCCISHLAVLHDVSMTSRRESGGSNWQELDELCAFFPEPSNIMRRGRGLFRAQLAPGFWCRWELYDTFHTYTFFTRNGNMLPEHAFDHTPLEKVPLEWLESIPKNSLICGTHLEIQACQGKFKAESFASDAYRAPFANRRIFASEFHSGAARAFTDFDLHTDGFSRVLVQDTRLSAREEEDDEDEECEGGTEGSAQMLCERRLFGRQGEVDLRSGLLVQQLLAIEVWRALSLNAETWAGHMSKRVEDLNRKHVHLMLQPTNSSYNDLSVLKLLLPIGKDSSTGEEAKHSVLDELCALHHQLEQLTAKYKPRLDRSHVWYQHICDLLGTLQEGPLPGAMRIGSFTRSRLEVLERDRRTVERDTAELGTRLRRSIELFNTQVAAARLLSSNHTAEKVQRLTVIMLVLTLLLGVQELHSLWEFFHERVGSSRSNTEASVKSEGD